MAIVLPPKRPLVLSPKSLLPVFVDEVATVVAVVDILLPCAELDVDSCGGKSPSKKPLARVELVVGNEFTVTVEAGNVVVMVSPFSVTVIVDF